MTLRRGRSAPAVERREHGRRWGRCYRPRRTGAGPSRDGGHLVALVVGGGGSTRAARRIDPAAAALVVPYLGWSAFALVLNTEIVRRNRPLGR